VHELIVETGVSTCVGDSGGPGLVMRDGVERVATVTSYGDNDCNGFSASTRVDVHAGWIAQMVAEHDPPACVADQRCVERGCPSADPDCPCLSGDGYCSGLCGDTDSDSDCPEGCGGGGVCVRGPACPLPDPDCGDPCLEEGHCLETCAVRDPDCAAPKESGDDCSVDFDCQPGAKCMGISADDPKVCWELCPDGTCTSGSCYEATPGLAVCRLGGGCSVAAPRSRAGWVFLLLGAAILFYRRRR
jgi:MYXO-CTERM domain-containing protein